MGRGKTERKKIEDVSGRQITFSKRHAGLLKKARELSILCDAEVAVIIFSSTGQLSHFASSSVNQVVSRYNKCVDSSEASVVKPEAKKLKTSDEVAVLKEESAQLKQRQMVLLGNDLTELGLNELQHLEQLLNDGLLSVRERKEQMLMYQLEQSRMKEKQMMLENIELQKQIEELQSYLAARAQPVSCYLESNQEERSSPGTHGALSHDNFFSCYQEEQIMPENKKLQKQFEELQSYLPTGEQPIPHFLEYCQENRSSPETHGSLSPDTVCQSGAKNADLFTTLQLGTPSHGQRKRKQLEQETAEKESFSGTSESQFDM